MMREPKNITYRESATETASKWVVKLNGGKLSKEDAFAFEDWLGESEAHRSAFKQVSAVWREAGALLDEPEAALAAPLSISRTILAWARINPIAARGVAAGVCASLLAAVFAAATVFIGPFQSDAFQIAAHTEIGESETMTLSDGSVVQLNTDTEMQIDYSASVRAVRLKRGEAFFEVAGDPDRPFRVIAGNSVVEAVGTAFAVQIANMVTEVTVAEGKVRLAHVKSAAAMQGVAAPASEATIAFVESGRTAAFDKTLISVEEIDDGGVEKKLAWRKGMLLFNGDSLETAVKEFERYTQTEIVILDEDIRNIRIVGYFSASDTDRFLHALENTFGIAVRSGVGGKVFLYRNDT